MSKNFWYIFRIIDKQKKYEKSNISDMDGSFGSGG